MGVMGQPRIDHPLFAEPLQQPRRDGATVEVMLLHAQRQGFGAAQGKPRVKWSGDGTGRVENKLEPIGQIILKYHRQPADHIRVTVDVLRGGMPDDVGTQLERTLENRRGEGVINDQQGLVSLRNVAHCGQVRQSHEGVGGRLHEQGSGGRCHRIFDPLRVICIHIGERQAEMSQNFVEQTERATIHVLPAHDVVARAEQLHDRVEAPHAASERKAVPPAFKRRDVPLQRLSRGVLSAGVFVALVDADALLHVGGREVEGRHDGTRYGIGALAGMDGARGHATREVFVENARHGLRLVRGDFAEEATAAASSGRVSTAGFLRSAAPRRAVMPPAVTWPTPPRDPRPAA